MAREKWEGKYPSHLDVTTPDTGRANLVADWAREHVHPTTRINEETIASITERYNGFSDEDDVARFFNEIILREVEFSSDVEREAAINYLKATFHQSGFLQLGSSQWCFHMDVLLRTTHTDRLTRKRVVGDEVVPFATVLTPKKDLVITTTPMGFVVDEIATFNSLMVGFDYRNTNNIEAQFFEPEADKDYVVKTRARVRLDFSDFSEDGKPKIIVEHNSVSYGNSLVEDAVKKTLHYKLLQLKLALNALEHVNNEAVQNLLEQGRQLLELIEPHRRTKDPQIFVELGRILDCCLATLKTPGGDKLKCKKMVAELATLASEVSGHHSPLLRNLGTSLLVFSSLALVAFGILAAIPTGGASLLAIVLSAVGVQASTAVTGIVVSGLTGLGFFKAGNEIGRARAVSAYKQAFEKYAEQSEIEIDSPSIDSALGSSGAEDIDSVGSPTSIDSGARV